YFKPEPSRKRKVEAIIDSLRDQIKELPGFEKIYFEKEHGGPPIGKAVSARVRGEDFKVLEEISQRIISFLSAIDGVTDIVSSFDSGGGEIRVVIDEEESTRSGLSVSDIGIAVRAAFKGAIATTIKPTKATEEIDVVVILPAEKRNNPLSFNDIIIENKFGQLIPLTSVARIEERKALTEILHLDGKRVVTVNADVDTEKTTSLEINRMLAKEFSAIEDDFLGYSIDYGGEQEENVKAARGFLKSFALGFFLIFMILAACFGSLIQPFVVMLAIPFGVIGVIWAFYFHQLPMSFFMMMGLVGLSGIVVNDSIVLVEFINNARRKGINRRESIIEAGRLRLRPVLLTTITTALGLTPTAYGIWGGDPFLRPMALTIVWGILCATVLTLLVLPCIYAIIDDITLKISGHFRREKNKPKEIK
ncbi:MAG: efflux RND transporter permease subunit, partial [Candidatus Omnitrophica bacterium]|nr:efflux RND transporter permease subunit [Candidatus Omnitrophota bacterium]